MSPDVNDPRVAAGMAAQFALRKRRIAAGEKPIGWKVGFGAKAAMEKLGTSAPLIGFLTSAGLLQSGDAVSLKGWTHPVGEPELAVHIEDDLAGDASDATVEAAIAGLAPAIELANLDPAPDRVETILSGNIYHRHVIVGALDRSRSGGSVTGLRAHVIRNGEEVASQSALEANTGRIVAIVRHVADVLAHHGERLAAGEFIIAGAVTPPLFLDSRDRELVHHVDGLGNVSVRFAP
ncbi:MAG: 2-keto-4-pentenoate hydratase [Propylenella sp.]